MVYTNYGLPGLVNKNWQGNIRELRNFIEKELITSGGNEIDLEIDARGIKKDSYNQTTKETTLNNYIETIEKEFIMRMYQKYPK